jgi:hypothetical protein
MDDLTPKQALFVDYYLQSFNATDAARRAGYKGNDKTLGVMGGENLKKPCIQAALQKRFGKVLAKNEKRIVNTYEEFLKNLEFVTKLRDASAKWLADPNVDGAFTIAPRAEEIDVVYTVAVGDIPFTHREPLSSILSRLADSGIPNPSPFVKTVDLREYALKTIDRIDKTLEQFAKMGGDYTQDKKNPADAQTMADKYAQARS